MNNKNNNGNNGGNGGKVGGNPYDDDDYRTRIFPGPGVDTTRGVSVFHGSGGGGYHNYKTCDHQPKAVKCGDTEIYASGRRYLKFPDDLRQFDFVVPLGSEFALSNFIKYTGFLMPFPIADFTAPDPDHLALVAERMLTFARNRNRVLTFCEGSHGRTGLVLATLIGMAEPDCADPIATVRARHCEKACETDAQIFAVFRALGREIPAHYKTGHHGSKQGFRTTEKRAWDEVMSKHTSRVATLPPAPKQVTPSKYFDGDKTPTPASRPSKPPEVSVAKCVTRLPDGSIVIPSEEEPVTNSSRMAAAFADGGDPTLDCSPFLFANQWSMAQARRLIEPLIRFPKNKHWLHKTKGIQCAVCYQFEKDPTRLTVSEAPLGLTPKQLLPHHLDCDEITPTLTEIRTARLAKHQPDLWAVYRDKRKHRRKRERRRGHDD